MSRQNTLVLRTLDDAQAILSRATLGRRAANATFHTSHAVDGARAITWAMDLTPLVQDDRLDPVTFTLAHVDRLRADIGDRLRRCGG